MDIAGGGKRVGADGKLKDQRLGIGRVIHRPLMIGITGASKAVEVFLVAEVLLVVVAVDEVE